MLRATKCWPFSVSRPAACSIFIPGHRGLKCCINGGCAVQHYESTGQYIQVFSPPSPSSRGGSSIGACLYSVLFCLSGATWAPQTAHALRLTLRFLDFTVSLFPFCSRRRRHRWDESLSLSAAILRNDFLFQGEVRSLSRGEIQGDGKPFRLVSLFTNIYLVWCPHIM